MSAGERQPAYYKQVALHVPSEIEYRFPYRLLRAGREQYTADYPTFRRRTMDVHHLVYIERGGGYLKTGSYRGELAAGSVAALFAGTVNDMGPHPDDPMEITWLVLAGEGFRPLMASAGLSVARPCVAIGEATEPRAIFRELRRRQPGAMWHVQSLLWAFLARIAVASGSRGLGDPPSATPIITPPDLPGRPIAPPPPVSETDALACDDAAVSRAIEAAHMHLREPDLRLDHLAHAAGLGRSRFAQRFRQVTGTSPMRYLERVRMEEARRRLEEDTPVARAAQLAGFDDALYFSRRFRTLHGLTPSAYRAVVRGARSDRTARYAG
jgi:AraC-like DNA-binding protein